LESRVKDFIRKAMAGIKLFVWYLKTMPGRRQDV